MLDLTTSRAARVLSRLTSALSGLGAMLVVLSMGMVVGSFVIPSSDPDPVTSLPLYTDLSPSSPVRLVIPSLKIRAPIVPVPLTDGSVLNPPRDPTVVGWWDQSTPPGKQRGQTVITGHTVHTGGGAMDSIGTLKPGQRVDVITRKGTMRYVVSKVRVLDKETVAQQAVALFGQDTGKGRLVLVSCDRWNGTFYESNVIVFGKPLGAPIAKQKATAGPQLEALSRS